MVDIVTIEIDGDTSELEKDLLKIPKLAKDTGARIDPIEFKFKEKELAQARQLLDGIRKQIREVKKEGGDPTELIINERRAKRAVTELNRELNNLSNTGDATTSRLQAKFDGLDNSIGGRFKSTIGKINGQFSKLGDGITNRFKRIGGVIAAAFSARAIIGFFKTAVDGAARFEQRMSDIGTLITGDSTQAVEELSNGIKDLVQELPVSADDLGASAYAVVSAGISDTADAMNVLEQSARLGVAGLSSTAEATDIMTSAVNAFGFEAGDADKVADILFKTVKNGKTTISDLSRSFGASAPIIASAGVSLEEFSAATAALTTSGLPASQAQNSLRAATVALIKPTTEMSKILKEAGFASGEAAIESLGFVGALDLIKEAADGNTETLGKAFGSVEALGAVQSLTGEQGEAFAATLRNITEDANAVDEAFSKQSETFSNQLQVFNNSIDGLKVAIGTALIPTLTSFADTIGDITNKLSGSIGGLDNFRDKITNFDIEGTIFGTLAQEIDQLNEALGKDQGELDELLEKRDTLLAQGPGEFAGQFAEELALINDQIAIQNGRIGVNSDLLNLNEEVQQRASAALDNVAVFQSQLNEALDEGRISQQEYTDRSLDLIEVQNSIKDGNIETINSYDRLVPTFQTTGNQIEDLRRRVTGQTAVGTQEIGQTLETGLATATDIATTGGNNVSTGFASGISSGQGAVTSATQSATSAVSTELQSNTAQASGRGASLISSFASGMESRISSVIAKARSVAQTVRSYLGVESPTELGPLSVDQSTWGENLVSAFADGLDNGAPLVEDALKSIAKDIETQLSNGNFDAVASLRVEQKALQDLRDEDDEEKALDKAISIYQRAKKQQEKIDSDFAKNKEKLDKDREDREKELADLEEDRLEALDDKAREVYEGVFEDGIKNAEKNVESLTDALEDSKEELIDIQSEIDDVNKKLSEDLADGEQDLVSSLVDRSSDLLKERRDIEQEIAKLSSSADINDRAELLTLQSQLGGINDEIKEIQNAGITGAGGAGILDLAETENGLSDTAKILRDFQEGQNELTIEANVELERLAEEKKLQEQRRDAIQSALDVELVGLGNLQAKSEEYLDSVTSRLGVLKDLKQEVANIDLFSNASRLLSGVAPTANIEGLTSSNFTTGDITIQIPAVEQLSRERIAEEIQDFVNNDI